MSNDVECTDPKVIAKEVYTFHKDLYSSSASNESTLLDNITHLTPNISQEFKEVRDAEIEMFEVEAAVKQLSSVKSPVKMV